MVLMAPANESEARNMLYTAYKHEGPSAVRYPRGSGSGVPEESEMTALPIGRAEIVRDGEGIAILAFGVMLNPSLIVGSELDATVVNMRFVRPLDKQSILHIAETHLLLVTIEDNVVSGGAGSGVNELLQEYGYNIPILNLGLPDQHIEQGSREQMLAACSLDPAGIKSAIQKRIPVELAATKSTA